MRRDHRAARYLRLLSSARLRRIHGFASAIAVVAMPIVAFASTIRVPEDSPSVLAATDIASPGDTVLVGPGVWTETATRTVFARNGTLSYTSCSFPRGGIVIRGQGAGVTTLDAGGSTLSPASGVVFVERTGEGALRLENLRLTGGGGRALIALYSDGVEMESCRFEGNSNLVGAGALFHECAASLVDCDVVGNDSPYGVLWSNGSGLTASRCRFQGNLGCCVSVSSPSQPRTVTFEDCLFTDNRVGPCVRVSGNTQPISVLVRTCEFVGNRGMTMPGGLCLNLAKVRPVTIERNRFVRNTEELGNAGAVRVAQGIEVDVHHNLFAYDSCTAPLSVAGGMRLDDCSAVVTNNTFTRCYAGGAACFSGGNAVAFQRNVVAFNPSQPCAGSSSSVTVGCNLWFRYGDGTGLSHLPTEIYFENPRFCDPDALDFTVSPASPCVDPLYAPCVPIGAYGVGCGPVSVEPVSFGRIKAQFR